MAVAHDPVDSPWPAAAAAPVLFLFDASNRVEEELLETWVRSTGESGRVGGDAHRVILAIAGHQEQHSANGLAGELTASGDTLVAPLRVVWLPRVKPETGAPRLRDRVLGDPRKPGDLRARQILRKYPARVKCIAGEPATIRQLQERYSRVRGADADPVMDEFAAFVARQAGLALDMAERRLQGSRYKVPRFVTESLENSVRFNTALHDLSLASKKSEAELRDEAHAYLREMIAIPGAFHIDAMGRFAQYIVSAAYEGQIVYEKQSIERIRKLVRENPAALLWTHKSHVDGFVMYSILYQNDFPAPHTLGGINMAFAGLGYLGRRAGAIFIRRSFQDNPLYKLVLRHYIGYLLEKRFPLSWAFEGTRSRVGKLMPPRYGLLKYVVEAARTTGARNLHLIPVSIGYDLITDVTDYAAEQAGQTKRPESLRWFLSYLSSLRKPMGRIYVEFGEPVVLKEAPDPEDRLALSKIAFEVARQANLVTPITLPSLGSMCLLGAAPQALTARELLNELRALARWARERGIRMTSQLDLDSAADMGALAGIMIERGMLSRYDEGPEAVFGIAPEQHLAASYYRNTVIHHFVNKAIIELALLRASEAPPAAAPSVFWEEAERLRDLFKFEFFYAPTDLFRQEIRQELSRYTDQWEHILEEGRQWIGGLLAGMQPFVAHSTLLHYVEAYTVVCDVVARQKPGAALDEKSCVHEAMNYGRQAYLQRRISSEASIAKSLFENGFKLVEHLGLTVPGATDLADRRTALAREFHDRLRRLERIRSMVMADRAGPAAADTSGQTS